MRTAGFIVLIVLSLGACDRTSRGLPQGGVAALDGNYRGDAALVHGRTNCPAEVPYAMTVRNGMAYGEAFNPRDPKTVLGRFEGLIDGEAKIGTKAWVGGDETLVEGYFERDRFLGSTKSENCTNRLTLRRVHN